MSYSHPLARIIACTRTGSLIRTRVNLDRTESGPIAPASLWLGDPPREKSARSIFQLHRLVSQIGNLFEFESSDEFYPQPQLPEEGSDYYFVGWWRRDQLALAQSNPKVFTRYRFVPTSPEDHDHCELCWKHICVYEHGEKEAYKKGNDSLCFECYDQYIVSGFGKYLGDAT